MICRIQGMPGEHIVHTPPGEYVYVEKDGIGNPAWICKQGVGMISVFPQRSRE